MIDLDRGGDPTPEGGQRGRRTPAGGGGGGAPAAAHGARYSFFAGAFSRSRKRCSSLSIFGAMTARQYRFDGFASK